MPRPRKHRHCHGRFRGQAFKPTGIPFGLLEEVHLAQDEMEALRLCDLEGLTQETAGERMGVSRGTVQRLVTEARKKVAFALVNGAAIVFEWMQQEESLPEGSDHFQGPAPVCGRGRRWRGGKE